MCAPTVHHRIEVEHDEFGRWTVVYAEDDFGAQHTFETRAEGRSLAEALIRLARKTGAVQPTFRDESTG